MNQNLSVTRHELIVHFVSSVVGCFIHYADHSIPSQAVWQALFLIIFNAPKTSGEYRPHAY
jgi:hypothetical protein